MCILLMLRMNVPGCTACKLLWSTVNEGCWIQGSPSWKVVSRGLQHEGHTTMSRQPLAPALAQLPPETKGLCLTGDQRQHSACGTDEGTRTAPAQTSHSLCGLGERIFPASASIYPSFQRRERASQVCRDLLVINLHCKLLRKVLRMQLTLRFGGCQETGFFSLSLLRKYATTEDPSLRAVMGLCWLSISLHTWL